MKRTLYEKIGGKYVPVKEYDPIIHDAFPKGSTLVVTVPLGRSYRHIVDPALAPLIAAGIHAEDAISAVIVRAQEMRPHRNAELTVEQRAAWEAFVEVMGDAGRYIEIPSAREATEAGVAALVEEAKKLMENPSVKLAYDHFMLVCQLAKDNHSSWHSLV